MIYVILYYGFRKVLGEVDLKLNLDDDFEIIPNFTNW